MPSRPYQSPRRTEAARATRAAILEAAARLFVEEGYTKTTLGQIATEAQVSLATVKNVFGTKRELLEAAVLAERTAAGMLRTFARVCADLHSRSAALIEAVRYGGAADPVLAELSSRGSQGRYDDLAGIVEAVGRRGALRKGLDARSATDILWALSSPSNYRDFVVRRGWSDERWAKFTGDLLVATLLGRG